MVLNAGASAGALEFARGKPIVFLTRNDLVDRILTVINVGAADEVRLQKFIRLSGS
jgi:hypothetical protein